MDEEKEIEYHLNNICTRCFNDLRLGDFIYLKKQHEYKLGRIQITFVCRHIEVKKKYV